MQINRWMHIAALAATLACGCSDDPAPPANPSGNNPNGGSNPSGGNPQTNPTPVTITAPIVGDTHWTADKIYVLATHIFVENGTLTIDAGARVVGESGSSLVVTQNGKIHAVGTATAPIVFSSAQAEGTRAPGDWGGVVLLGKSPINPSGGTEKIEGFAASEDRTSYGGSDSTHDCGKLKYVRIEFAGFELAPDNELNGLTVGGCGDLTEIDYVQVHKGADDGVEMFGGTANLRHILITQPDDDGLDWDFGWQGKVQFLVVQQNSQVGNNGIEADNNVNNNDATPRSQPELWNVTLVGSATPPGLAGKSQWAMLLRRGTAGKISNALVYRFTDGAIDVANPSTVSQANGGSLSVKSSIFWDNAAMGATFPAESMDNDNGFDEAAFFTAAGTQNRSVDPQLTDALNLGSPNFLPAAGSPALAGGTPPGGFFDASATYVGAFGSENWISGWTAFPSN